MSAVWMFLEIALGVLGSILVWATIAGIVSDARERHRSRVRGRTGNNPPARS